MELLKDIAINIYYNMYSYSVYVVIGVIFYIVMNYLVLKFSLSTKVIKVIIILLAMFLPICSCISITFLLYKRIVKDEKFILSAYLLSVFFSLSAFILIRLYIGKQALNMYIIIIAFALVMINVLIHVFDKRQKKVLRLEEQNNKKDINLYYVSYFAFIHFIGLAIMSILNVIFKNIQYLDIANNNENIFYVLLNRIIFEYTCIPNDALNIGQLVYRCYSVSFIIPLLVISIMANIPELLLLIINIKHKIIFVFSILFSSAFIGMVFYIFENNDVINKNSINYDDKLFSISKLLNINPNNLMRNTSIILYIVLLLYYSQKKES